MVMKSFLGSAANSRSKSVAVTMVSSFSAKRRAVSFTILNAVGSTSLRAISYLSSASFSNLSIWLKIPSRSSIGVSSILALSSAILAFSSLAYSCTYFWISFVLARSSSLLKALILGYSALIFSTIGWINFMSRVDLLPNND